MGSRDSAVGIATGYELDDGVAGGRVPVRAKNILFRRPDRFSPFPSAAPYLMGTEGSFYVGKAGECEAHHSPQQCRDQENMNLYIHSPIRLHGVLLN
jgi:hypothetical protein